MPTPRRSTPSSGPRPDGVGPDEPRPAAETEWRDSYSRYAGLGIQLAATIGLFAWGGHWLDGKIGTRPIFLIAGVLLGFVGALISMVRRMPPSGGGRSSRTPPGPSGDRPPPD